MENIQEREQYAIQARFKEILERGVAIATSSDFRKKVMGQYIDNNGNEQGVGFSEVIGISNDTVEPNVLEAYEAVWPIADSQKKAPLDKSDIYRSRQIEAIAKGKLEDMLARLTPEEKQKVCIGIDTAPLYFTIKKGNENYQYHGDALFKPGHYELELPDIYTATCTFLVENIRKDLEQKIQSSQSVPGAEVPPFTAGVQVTTGIAVQVPGDPKGIRTESVSVFMQSKKIQEIAAIDSSQQREAEISSLVQQLIDISLREGKPDPKQVSGGINFGDSDIRDAFDMTQVYLDDNGVVQEHNIEAGIFLGAPEEAIRRLLMNIASETL